MATENVRGVVEAVKLERVEAMTAVRYGVAETPIKAKLVLRLADGSRAYASKGVGDHREELYAVGDYTNLAEDNAAKDPSAWPLVIDYTSGVVRSDSPEVFPHAAVVVLHIIPTLWVGDEVTLRGSVERKTSKAGNAYLQLNRIKVLGVTRDGVTWGTQASSDHKTEDGRELCAVCGMLANGDPWFHAERYAHEPEVLRGGARLVHNGRGAFVEKGS